MRAKKDEIPIRQRALKRQRGRKRLYGVMDKHLAAHAFFADEYSIADIALYPGWRDTNGTRVDLAGFANVKRWFASSAHALRWQRAWRYRRCERARVICARASRGTRGYLHPQLRLARDGLVPTTRFIHSIFSCIRTTTARHSTALCRSSYPRFVAVQANDFACG